MNLREYYKSWDGKPVDELRQSYPGPFLLINWPVEENPWNRQLFALQEGSESIEPCEYLLGRVAACAITIHEAGISSRHALLQRVSPRALSRWTLVDLCSTNGTYTEETRLIPTEPEVLSNGQCFLLGTEVQVCFLTFDGIQSILTSADGIEKKTAPSESADQIGTETTRRYDRVRFNAMLSKKTLIADSPFKGGSTMRLTTPMPWPRSPGKQIDKSKMQKAVAETADFPRPDLGVKYWLNVEGHEAQLLSPNTPFVLGRSAALSNLRLNHPLVSRRHVTVTVENGVVFVEDMGSSNGTVVGTYDITGKKVALEGNHSFWIGPFCLKVTSDKVVRKVNNPCFTTQIRLKLDSKASMGITYSGEISTDMPVSELLQGIEFNEKTGTLFVEGTKVQGLMSFKSGRPFFSESHGRGGIKRGPDSIYRLLDVNDGQFSFAKAVDDSPANVSISVTGALVEFSRQQDERALKEKNAV
jgi:pSer/pThr/pTyr-binding forkhead associated (FHA) protein